MRRFDFSHRSRSRRRSLSVAPVVLLLAAASCGGAPTGEGTPQTLDLYGAATGGGESLGGAAPADAMGKGATAATSDEPTAPVVTGCASGSGRWCSALYPPSWTAASPPDAEGRFFHDFSYAGYRAGEAPPPSPPGETFDATRFGADKEGRADATSAIAAAIAAASSAGGGVVFLPAGHYRVGGRLTVEASGVVLRGEGASSVLHFTTTRGMGNQAHLSFAGHVTRDAPRRLAVDAPSRAREIALVDASDLAPGDDVALGWTISAPWVAEHGMTGTWTAFAGNHEPFFRSRVVSVDTHAVPHKVVLDVPLRYPAKVRDGAGLQKESGYLREVGLEHVGVTNATTWSEAWAEDHLAAVAMRGVADAWALDVHSVANPAATGMSASDARAYHLASAGLVVEDAKRVSVLGSSMENPQNRGSGGNGYLFEVSRTSDVLFADCVARSGRHDFIQNWGFGNAGTVLLRCTSTGSEMLSLIGGKLVPEASTSEHHHSLAMASLVDSCTFDDGFKSENRGAYSSGAGHTATEGVVWNASGSGTITSKQFGWGYVIGTHEGLAVDAEVASDTGAGTAPRDMVEGRAKGATLWPSSLYEDQRKKRLFASAQP